MIKKHEVYNIIVTGKSGAGKQPRIDIIAEELDLEQLSTGAIYRECIAAYKAGEKTKEAELGGKAIEYYNAGKFVPDEVTNQMFEEYFKRYDYKGCILDGYPRTIAQAEFLLNLLEKNNSRIDMIIEVHREDKQILNHLIYRRTCKDCKKVYNMKDNPPTEDDKCACGGEVFQRSDDTEEAIKSRLDEFHKNIEPMLEYFKEQGYSSIRVNGYLNPWSKERMRETVLEALMTLEDPVATFMSNF